MEFASIKDIKKKEDYINNLKWDIVWPHAKRLGKKDFLSCVHGFLNYWITTYFDAFLDSLLKRGVESEKDIFNAISSFSGSPKSGIICYTCPLNGDEVTLKGHKEHFSNPG